MGCHKSDHSLAKPLGSAPASRRSLGGTTVLSFYDIVAAAGAANKAVVEEFTAIADGSGQIALTLVHLTESPQINGIELLLEAGTSTSATSYGYDPNGNQVRATTSEGTTTYTWDSVDRLQSAQLPSGAITTQLYRYDGLRVNQVSGSGVETWIWDGEDLLSWDGPSGAGTQLLVQGPALIQAMGSAPDGTAVNRQYHLDNLGTVQALSDGSGSVETDYQTDAWGNELAGSAPQNRSVYLGGLGYWQEPLLGLDYVRGRWLNTETGSWLSTDPVAGELRYRYADNQPTVLTDPQGTQAQTSRWVNDLERRRLQNQVNHKLEQDLPVSDEEMQRAFGDPSALHRKEPPHKSTPYDKRPQGHPGKANPSLKRVKNRSQHHGTQHHGATHSSAPSKNKQHTSHKNASSRHMTHPSASQTHGLTRPSSHDLPHASPLTSQTPASGQTPLDRKSLVDHIQQKRDIHLRSAAPSAPTFPPSSPLPNPFPQLPTTMQQIASAQMSPGPRDSSSKPFQPTPQATYPGLLHHLSPPFPFHTSPLQELANLHDQHVREQARLGQQYENGMTQGEMEALRDYHLNNNFTQHGDVNYDLRQGSLATYGETYRLYNNKGLLSDEASLDRIFGSTIKTVGIGGTIIVGTGMAIGAGVVSAPFAATAGVVIVVTSAGIAIYNNVNTLNSMGGTSDIWRHAVLPGLVQPLGFTDLVGGHTGIDPVTGQMIAPWDQDIMLGSGFGNTFLLFANKPLTEAGMSVGKTLPSLSQPRLPAYDPTRPILFGQRRISPKFSDSMSGKAVWDEFVTKSGEGKTLSSVVKALIEGRMKGRHPIYVFEHFDPVSGKMVYVATNNRGFAVLAKANIRPKSVKVIRPSGSEMLRLEQLPVHADADILKISGLPPDNSNGLLPSRKIAVTHTEHLNDWIDAGQSPSKWIVEIIELPNDWP